MRWSSSTARASRCGSRVSCAWFDRSIPIIDYVSPSVWAWRAGRARSMRGYIDHVLALLPFEPDVHRRLGGPPCSYVGHPLIEEVDSCARTRPKAPAAARRSADRAGDARQPQRRDRGAWPAIFGEASALVAERVGPIEVVVPTVPHLLATGDRSDRRLAGPAAHRRRRRPRSARRCASRARRSPNPAPSRSSLRSPACRWSQPTRCRPSRRRIARRLIRVHSVILANLVIGENVVPELVQEDCTPDRLAAALVPLLSRHAGAPAPGRGIRRARRHHGDRLADAGSARRRNRAGNAAAAWIAPWLNRPRRVKKADTQPAEPAAASEERP